MSRDLSAAALAAIAARKIMPVYLCEMLVTTPIRVWTGYQYQTWNGNTWSPVGSFGGFSPASEALDMRADNITFMLSGIPSDVLSFALTEKYRGKSVKLWLGLMDTTTLQLLDDPTDPIMVWSGKLDVATIKDAGDKGAVSITSVNKMATFKTPKLRRYTNEDQKLDYPLDQGLKFLVGQINKEIKWGRS